MVKLDWLVVGGGPAGTCAVAYLLEREASVGWLEKGSFEDMGRLGKYASVPANTRNDRLVEAFESLAPFDFRAAQQRRRESERLPSNLETADLAASLRALRDASRAMRGSSQLALCAEGARVRKLTSDGAGVWTVEASTAGTTEVHESKRVFLATGAAPKEPDADMVRRLKEAGIRVLAHDDVVAPDLYASLPPLSGVKVALVGGAHSGMLAAMNVLGANGEATVAVFDRKPAPRFAEERDGWIRFDGTGLKGPVALWTRHALANEKRLSYEQIRPEDDLVAVLQDRGAQAVAFTVGFEKQRWADEVSYRKKPVGGSHDPRTGRLAPGLHGLGIAYPEYWTDPSGYTEPRVGFVNHFIKHIGRAYHAALQEEAEIMSSP